jgi:sialic acid synthase SpsE
MSLDVKATIRTTGDAAVLTREEKEAQGLVPAPIRLPGVEPLRWSEFRLIAEIGGVPDLSTAKDMALAARLAGFWALKVQILNRGTLVSPGALSYGQGIKQAERQWDDFAGHGLDRYDLASLQAYCNELGLLLFASCWDEDSVDLACDLGFPLLKIGSGDITHEWLLRYIAHAGKPVILSTGASYRWEIDRALEWLADAPQVALAACTLAYPCPAQDAHLNRIRTLREAFPSLIVGYSDHCREPWIVGQAKKAGALFVEVHWTTTPGAGGDHDFALHPSNVKWLFDTPADWNGDHWGNGNLVPADCELPARNNARRSLAANVPIGRGERFRPWDITYLRPGIGVQPYQLAEIVGRKALRDYEPGDLLDPYEA